jgi:GNAT superfamily N-acetyltransferase
MQSNSTVHIRRGASTDLPSVLELIHELAQYERASHEVTNHLALMQEQFMQDAFALFIAEIDRTVVGAAVYFYSYSTWKGRSLYLDDLVVTESMRGKGIGKKLLDAVIAEAKRQHVAKVHWQVLEWNTPAIRFYERTGAFFDHEWVNCKLEGALLESYT